MVEMSDAVFWAMVESESFLRPEVVAERRMTWLRV